MTAADKFGIAFSIGFTVALIAIALSFSVPGKSAPAPVVPITPPPAPAPVEETPTPPVEETPAEETPEETPTEEVPPEEEVPAEEEPTPEEETPATDEEVPMEDMIMTLDVSISEGASTPGCEEDSTCFVESDATVSTGGTVTWSNDDSAAHTVTSGTPTDGPDGVFDSSIIMAGKTFEFTFEEAGEYDYFCVVHPWMTGKITVE